MRDTQVSHCIYSKWRLPVARRRFVYARNSEGQCVALDIYIAEGETEITAGTYPVLQGTDLSNPYMSVHASEGVISGFTTPSYAGYLNAASELQSPVWYIMAGGESLMTKDESKSMRSTQPSVLYTASSAASRNCKVWNRLVRKER